MQTKVYAEFLENLILHVSTSSFTFLCKLLEKEIYSLIVSQKLAADTYRFGLSVFLRITS